MPFTLLKENLNNYAQLSNEEFDQIVKLFKVQHFKKNEFILKEGDFSQHDHFVVKGCLKKFFLDNSLKEHIILFIPEEHWAYDIQSSMNKLPSRINIKTLEDSILLSISIDEKEKILQKIPKLELITRQILQKNHNINQKRIIDSLTKTAEQQYKEFIHNQPELTNRLTNKSLASYLGITHEFISKIRRKISKER